MCGRYTLIADIGDLAQRFEFDGADFRYDPGYNIAPTESVLTVRNVEGREAALMRWGLVPFWSKDLKIGARMINARAETVAEKPAFRNALKKRRCLVLADGYYEWQKTPTGKRPFRIIMKSGKPFAMAGLWETWKDPQGNVVPSCTIITTAANDYLAPIHNRMPVILPQESEETWLDLRLEESEDLAHILVPSPNEALDAYEVSTIVNSARNDGPEIIARVRYSSVAKRLP